MKQTLVVCGDKTEFNVLDIGPLVDAILAPTIPNRALGITHPGNWPADATHGITYKVHDRQFPQVRHEPETRYFTSHQEFANWLARKGEWISGTDYDFSLEGSLYKWDFGPELISQISL